MHLPLLETVQKITFFPYLRILWEFEMVFLGEVSVEHFPRIKLLLAVDASLEMHLTADIIDQLHLTVKVQL